MHRYVRGEVFSSQHSSHCAVDPQGRTGHSAVSVRAHTLRGAPERPTDVSAQRTLAPPVHVASPKRHVELRGCRTAPSYYSSCIDLCVYEYGKVAARSILSYSETAAYNDAANDCPRRATPICSCRGPAATGFVKPRAQSRSSGSATRRFSRVCKVNKHSFSPVDDGFVQPRHAHHRSRRAPLSVCDRYTARRCCPCDTHVDCAMRRVERVRLKPPESLVP